MPRPFPLCLLLLLIPLRVCAVDDPGMGVPVATAISVNEGNAGTSSATILLRRTGGTAGVISVDVATSDGSALAGSDYTAVTQTVSWADGDAVDKAVTIPILGDTAVEPDETFQVDVATTIASGGMSLVVSTPVTVTIVNDDVAPPAAGVLAFASCSQSAVELASVPGGITFSVMRIGSFTGAVGVTWATHDGTATAGNDYTAATGTLTWADGVGGTKTITIATANDAVAEADETFTVVLSAPTGGAVLAPLASVATGTLLNDDGAVTCVGSIVQASEPATGAGTASVWVQRVGGAHGRVTVDYATSPGTGAPPADYTTTSGTLVWEDGDGADKRIAIPIFADAIPRNLRDFHFTLSNPQQTGMEGVAIGRQASVKVYIRDLTAAAGVTGTATTGGVAGGCGAGGLSLILAGGLLVVGLRRRR